VAVVQAQGIAVHEPDPGGVDRWWPTYENGVMTVCVMTVCGCSSRVCTVMQYMSHNGANRHWPTYENGVMTVCVCDDCV